MEINDSSGGGEVFTEKTEHQENQEHLSASGGDVPPEENLLNSEGELKDESTSEAQMLPQIWTPDQTLGFTDRAALFCDHILGACTAEDADEAVDRYISKKIGSKHSWPAVWKPPPEVLFTNWDIGDLPGVGVLVQVNYTPSEDKDVQLHVTASVAEPFSSNVTNLSRELVEEVLKDYNYSLPILDIYPVQELGSEVDDIAEAVEHARFFYDVLWRDWDEEEECTEYAGLIEKRLQLYFDIQDGTIPGPVSKRYRTTLEEYRNKRLELAKFQFSICGEMTPGDAVDCWKKSHGPFYSRTYKRRKGRRPTGKTVTHIVAQMMTTDMERRDGVSEYPSKYLGYVPNMTTILKATILDQEQVFPMIKNFSLDSLIQQHDSLEGALESCFSGDLVVLFPGEYQADSMASLSDDIHMKGAGERQQVVIYSEPSSDSFVASRASQVTLQDLTLVQRGTCDGIVVVESGQMTLENCVLKCEGIGVCVLTGASLIMTNCEITGAQGAGVELYPGSVAELHKNEIHRCSSQMSEDPKNSLGGVSVKVIPEPKLKMSDNYIHDNYGYGVTVLMPDGTKGSVNQGLEVTGDGDTNEPDQLTKAIQKLSLKTSTNKLESNSLGDVGLLHKTCFTS